MGAYRVEILIEDYAYVWYFWISLYFSFFSKISYFGIIFDLALVANCIRLIHYLLFINNSLNTDNILYIINRSLSPFLFSHEQRSRDILIYFFVTSDSNWFWWLINSRWANICVINSILLAVNSYLLRKKAKDLRRWRTKKNI